MPLNKHEKKIFLIHKGKPIVGLIHKETKQIVLAPCIPSKVFLKLTDTQEAESGSFLEDDFSVIRALNPEELVKINGLLKEGHVPRLAFHPSFHDVSSHELLFIQKCNTSKRSDWGGFAFKVNPLNDLEFEFVSGAFNSPKGTRIKGAKLAEDLIDDVIEQITNLLHLLDPVADQENAEPLSQNQAASELPPPAVTPPKKPKLDHKFKHSDLSNQNMFSQIPSQKSPEKQRDVSDDSNNLIMTPTKSSLLR